ncbi:MAG: AAA family ATPase [Verrucomicrobia bacterium]|nr:AAA family ATPase [Verrucomicrobiota bacterium]
MKLLSAHIQNYRVHRDCSVDLDSSLSLLHGPNESGKSTLAEAIHSALFLKAKGSTSFHTKMQSDFGGDPEVRVEFNAGGRHHTLTKRFGSKGNTTLESEGQATLNGDAAEDALARLLGVEGTVSGGGIEGKMQKRWAHLWVWQGQSNESPVASIEESHDQLREKLQAQSGQTLASSQQDAAVIRNLQDLVDATLLGSGKAKKGSDLARAETELNEAQAALAEKETILADLNKAADDYERASADQIRYRESLADGQARLKTITEDLATVRKHREALKEKSRERETIGKQLEELRKADGAIRELETDLKAAQKAAAPGDEALQKMEANLKDDKAARDQAIEAREAASQALARCRTAHDALQAQVKALETEVTIAKLQKEVARITKLQTEAKALRKQLAPLDGFTEKAIKALRKKSTAASEAQARLDAFALQLDVLESDQAIRLDGTDLKAGESKTAEAAFETARKKHQTAKDKARDLATKLNYAIETNGDTEARAKTINKIKGQHDQALAAEKSETDALKKLGADQLELDEERLNKSVDRDKQNLDHAKERLVIAETELKSNGSTDPERERKELQAAVEQIQRRHDALRHQAEVRLHLLNRLKEARKATTSALARPLEV